MRALFFIALENFRLLRRDRIFVPAIFVCVLVAALANLASDWSIEDFRKILVDIGYFGFFVMGNAIAMFWGVKTLADARASGSLEVQLAAPVARATWLIGRYAGLGAALLLLALPMLGFWQALMLLNAFGWMTPPELIAFAFIPLSWLVSAALAMLLATFCGQGVALFGTASLWIAGLSTRLVANSLPEDASQETRRVVLALARYWDLQQLNLVDFASGMASIGNDELVLRASYGLALIGICMGLGALIFQHRDAI